jgi:hypothetical protein
MMEWTGIRRPFEQQRCWGCENRFDGVIQRGKVNAHQQNRLAYEFHRGVLPFLEAVPLFVLIRGLHQVWVRFIYQPNVIVHPNEPWWSLDMLEMHFKYHIGKIPCDPFTLQCLDVMDIVVAMTRRLPLDLVRHLQLFLL